MWGEEEGEEEEYVRNEGQLWTEGVCVSEREGECE